MARDFLSNCVNIYADESRSDRSQFHYISLVFCSASDEGFWAQRLKACMDKRGVHELHGTKIKDKDGKHAAIACQILQELKLQSKPTLSLADHPIAFLVLGIRKDKQLLQQFFGRDDLKANLYRRFLRSAISFGLKKFCGMNELHTKAINLVHFYHDANREFERNQLFAGDWLLKKLKEELPFNFDTFASDTVEFIDSHPHKSGKQASYLIQLADLLAWLVRVGESKEVLSDAKLQAYHQSRLLHVWGKEFMPSLLCDSWSDFCTLFPDEEDRDEQQRKYRFAHLAFFPDSKGYMYTPYAEDFSY